MAKSKSKKKVTSKPKSSAKSHALRKPGPDTSFYTIQISDMSPTNPNGPAEAGQVIQFVNNDSQNYSLQFRMSGNTDYLVGVLLYAKGTNGGTCFMTANAAGTCTYDINPWMTSAKPDVVSGGPHTIIISSGARAKTAGAGR
jgi:hypothetical protein